MLRFLLLFLFIGQSLLAQNINTFTSIVPQAQDQSLTIPLTHRFQLLASEGEPYTVGGGNMLALNDFTCYVPIANSSTNGYLSVNHEVTGIGGQSVFDINYSILNRLWQKTASVAIDFAPVVRASRLCSGGLTPWGTVIAGEETVEVGDVNLDGYQDVGWLVETNPVTKTVIGKLWAVGRAPHENCVVNAAGTILYTGADHGTVGFVYKFVPTVANNMNAGIVYALQKTGNTGTWLPIANTTQTDRNNKSALAAAAGATNFVGVEDVEIGPDGKVYFASKGTGSIFRFNDNGLTVSNLDTFVVNTNYTINYGTGTAVIPWGLGADNLAFDGQGNLWVLQDGGNNYIWMVRPTHTAAIPQIELFGRIPLGGEPTGITFSPDYKFMFISVQHPSVANTLVQTDAAGTNVVWNKSSSLVIARWEDLGLTPLSVSKVNLDINCRNNFVELISDYSGLNNAHELIIEKSFDGYSFFETHHAQIEKDGSTIYSEILEKQDTYYRVVLKDIHGSLQYSKTVKSHCSSPIITTNYRLLSSIHPKGQVQLECHLDEGDYCHYTIYSITGRKLVDQQLELPSGQSIHSISTENLPSGNYVFVLNNSTGGIVYKELFLH